jgi:hypothetical protein
MIEKKVMFILISVLRIRGYQFMIAEVISLFEFLISIQVKTKY